MRILLLNDDALPSARGGAAVVTDLLRRELSQRGHDVLLVTTHQNEERGEKVETKDEAGKTISIFRKYPLSERHSRCIRDARMSTILEKICADFRPDVAHAHNLHTYLTYDALTVTKTSGAKTLLTAHDTFLVSFGRVGTHVRTLHWWDHVRAAGRKFSPGRNAAIRSILKQTDTTVVSISETLKHFLTLHSIESSVIHNGVRIPEHIPNADEAKKSFGLTGPVALYGGRVSADKGMPEMLKAFAEVLTFLPNATLLVMGDKERIEPFLHGAPAAVQKATVMTGWLPHADVTRAYAAADVVCTPSVYLDPFNLINLEAMAAGKPVVGTCFGGTPEIVVDGKTGYVRDPRNTEAFSHAIVTILKDPTLAAIMGTEGKKRAESHFSLSRQADLYLNLYSVPHG